MKFIQKMVGSSILMGLLTMMLMLGAAQEAKAQPAPLMVMNSQPCDIWVQGQTGMGLTPGCLTGWVMIPASSMGAIMPCAGPTWDWYHVNYTTCPPGFCPQGMTNSPVAICGMPAVVIPNCTGGPFTPVWAGTASVTF